MKRSRPNHFPFGVVLFSAALLTAGTALAERHEWRFLRAEPVTNANVERILGIAWVTFESVPGSPERLGDHETETLDLFRDGDVVQNYGEGPVREYHLTRSGLMGRGAGLKREEIRLEGSGDIIVKRERSGGETTYLVCRKGLAEAEFVSGPCGVAPEDDVEVKIRDCSQTKMARGYSWDLVTRDELGVEIWRDRESGLSVSRRMPSQRTFKELMELEKREGWDRFNPFHAKYVEREPAYCRAEETRAERGNLEGLPWEFPEKEDFDTLEKHGVRDVLPFMNNDWFWTYSVSSTPGPWIYDGVAGRTYMSLSRAYVGSVVCVAR